MKSIGPEVTVPSWEETEKGIDKGRINAMRDKMADLIMQSGDMVERTENLADRLFSPNVETSSSPHDKEPKLHGEIDGLSDQIDQLAAALADIDRQIRRLDEL